MKTETLSKDGALKLRKSNFELYFSDIKSSTKHFTPGEWFFLFDEALKCYYLATVNTFIPKNIPSIKVYGPALSSMEGFDLEKYLFSLIASSVNKRKKFHFINACARLVFGGSDFLPGLVVDSYKNAILIQINTAGLDLFRDKIFHYFSQSFPNKKIIQWDNEKQREREQLPIFPKQNVDEIVVNENDMELVLSGDTLQKVGFYYDHRDNRIRMKQLLQKLKINAEEAVDLYSYCGAWGISLAQSGIEKIVFVDQADMLSNISRSWKANKLAGEFEFIRDDVYKFLDAQVEKNKKYKLICSDPPAFAKSKNEKNAAIEGYKKLHKKIFKCLMPDSLLFSSSCTHYVNHEEFQNLICEVAAKEGRQIQLLDIGMQSHDHPIKNIYENSNYIKYFAYWVE